MILDVLYSAPGQRLGGGGFLEMTALALSGIMERISALTDLHILAQSLDAIPPRRHLEIEQLVDMIAAVGDKSALGRAVGGADAVRQEWMAGFRALHQEHRRLEVAVQVATDSPTYSKSWADARDLRIGSPEQELAGLILTARAWQGSRRSMRNLVASALPEIAGGIDDARVDLWLTEATTKLTSLEHDLMRYREHRQELLRLARQNLHTDQASVQLEARLARLAEELSAVAQKKSDLEEVIADRRDDLVSFEETFQRRSGATGQGAMRRLRRGTEQVISLSAADVPNGLPGDPLSYAVGHPMALKKGDWIEIAAHGQWATTHALRMNAPGLVDSIAGPGGFDIVVNESLFQSSSRGEQCTNFSNESASQESYHSAGVEASAGFMAWGNGVQVRSSIGQRGSRTKVEGQSVNRTEQQQGGQETRSGKSFRLPLCLPNTPFPDLPAGSLVMVQVEDGRLVDTAVVSGLYTTRSQVDGEMYFIINDASPRGTSDNGHKVSVRASVSYSPAETEAAVHAAMGELLQHLSTRLQDGPVSDPRVETREEVFAWATQSLAERGFEHLDLPDSWREFFLSWVVRHHAQFERQVALSDLQTSLRLLLIEREGVRREAGMLQDQRRLTRTEATWLSQNFDIEYLKSGVRSVSQFLGKTLVPYTRLTDSSFSTDQCSRDTQLSLASDKMMQLPRAGSSESSRCDYGTNAEGLIHFGRFIVDRVRTQRAIRPPSHEQVVRVVIPRGRNRSETVPRYAGKVIAEERAARFWQAVDDNEPACVDIRMSDLYTSHPSVQSMLRDRCELPIVRQMGLFFDTGTNLHFEALNASQPTIEMELAPHVTFALASGSLDYVVRGETWRYYALPVLTGPKERVLAEFRNWQSNSGQPHRVHGVTPFGRHHIDFSRKGPDLELILQHAEALVMVISLEVRPCGERVYTDEN